MAGKKRIEDLVEAHYASLYRYAFRLSGKGAEAEDLTQEAFVQAQVKIAQLREWDRARNWLFSILRNLYLHRLRAARKETALSLEGMAELPERAVPALPEIEPQRLQEVLNALPENVPYPDHPVLLRELLLSGHRKQMDLPIGTVMLRLGAGQGVPGRACSVRRKRSTWLEGGWLMDCNKVACI
ncbi:MAG: RNA polymerase sigma factor [Gemmataceae bacterium]